MKNPGLPTTYIEGRLVADPELRATNNGKAVASLTIASGERRLNRDTNEWEDGNKIFLRCTAWEDLATNIAASLSKGDPVLARVRISHRQYTTKDGDERTVVEGTIDSIGVTLDRHTVAISRADGGPAGGGYAKPGFGHQPSYGQTEGGGYGQGQPSWGQPVAPQAEQQPLGGFDDEQPF